MKVLVIGLGSMGKRRIRLLKQIDETIMIVGVDAKLDRCLEVEGLYGISTCESLEEAISEGCDAAFVCTAPLSHAELISKCLENGINVFTEINLVADGYEKNIQLAKQNNLTLFLSSTFLYREEIQYIKNQVEKSGSLLTYSYHIGQYLPDWHPWENYTDYFIGNDRTNGCREIMAIEFPWLVQVFGKVVDISVKKNKKTSLKTSYCDSYLLLMEHENGIQGTLLVDVVSRKAVRNLEIFGEDLYLSWDGSPSGLKQYDIDEKKETDVLLYKQVDRQDGYAAFVIEDAYRKEIMEFMSIMAGEKEAGYGFQEDMEILKLIDRVEGKV